MSAVAFGPFRDRALDLSPGLTVIWGLNEAGKSTWHSAMQLAIGGVRRGQGRSLDERQLRDRRKPWAGERWALSAELDLDSGEHLTVVWNLAERTAQVLDGLGRDRSNEWLTQGSCDLARIVGLDRTSFVSTACVRQSDIQGVRSSAPDLQDVLQKAATSALGEATAATALTIIDGYAREHVGSERSNSTKPLAQARRRVDQTRQQLDAARAEHDDRMQLLEQLSAKTSHLATRRDDLAAIEAAHRLALLRTDEQHYRKTVDGIEELRRKSDDLEVQTERSRALAELAAAHLGLAEAQEALSRAQDLTRSYQRMQDRDRQLAVAIEQLTVRAQVLTAALSLAEAREQLASAQSGLQAQEDATAAAAAASAERDKIHCDLLVVRVAQAERVANRARDRAERAAALFEHQSRPSSELPQENRLIQESHTLLHRWTHRPDVPQLSGPSAGEIAAEIESLPPTPVGDLTPAAEVLEAERNWRVATARQRDHLGQEPLPAVDTDRPLCKPSELREWAAILDAPIEDPGNVAVLLRDTRAAAASAGTPRRVALAAALTGLGVVLAVLVNPALALLGVVGIILGAKAMARRAPPVDEDLISRLEARLTAAQAASANREQALTELHDHKLPAEPATLRRLALEEENASRAQQAHDAWGERRSALRRDAEGAASHLWTLLETRGVAPEGGAEAAIERYRADCSARSEQDRQSQRRQVLEAQLERRQFDERQLEEVRADLADLHARLVSTAVELGLPSDHPAAAASHIQDWLDGATARERQRSIARTKAAELAVLLEGSSLEQLRAEAHRCEANLAKMRQEAEQLGFLSQASCEGLADHELDARLQELAEQYELAVARSTALDVAARDSRQTAAVAFARDAADEAEAVLRALAPQEHEKLAHLSHVQLTEEFEACRLDLDRSAGERERVVGAMAVEQGNQPDMAARKAEVTAAEEHVRTLRAARPELAALLPPDGDTHALSEAIRIHRIASDEAASKLTELKATVTERERDLRHRQLDPSCIHEAEAEFTRLAAHASLSFTLAALPGVPELQAQVDRGKEDVQALAEEVANIRGQLERQEVVGLDRAAATEAHEAAKGDLEEVLRLARVLETTKTILSEAQDRVHRDIAPALNHATNRWMAEVFGPRYSGVLVDPASLSVMVLGPDGAFHAELLSQGTTEQIYLLLRIALVETLTAGCGEVCPMILDDVTVNFDRERKLAVLKLLSQVARERQIVLFTQEDDVRAWAERHPESANLICLEGRAGS